MSIATIEVQPRVVDVDFVDDKLVVSIEDGRVLLVPQAWYPRLQQGTKEERQDWRIFEDTEVRDVLFWEQLDELIPVVALLSGVASQCH